MTSWWVEQSIRAMAQGTALTLFVYLLTRVFNGMKPSVKALLWLVVLLHFAIAWSFAISIHLRETTGVANFLPQVATHKSSSIVGANWKQSSSSVPAISFACAAFVVWFAGALAVLAYDVYGIIRMVLIKRQSTSASEDVLIRVRQLAAELGLSYVPRVCLTNALSAPATFGLFRPCLYLPFSFSDLSEDERDMAFVHELGHIARHDLPMAIVAEVATVLYWYFPIVYFARNEWNIERELACDALVVEMCGDPQGYRRLLLRIVGKDDLPLPRAALGATADFRCLRRRLLAKFRNTRKRTEVTGALCVLAAAAVALPIRFAPLKESGGGLINNPSFEEGAGEAPDGWTSGQRIDGVRYVWDETVAHSGRRSLSIQKRVNRFFPIAEWTQTVPYDGHSQAVAFQGWVRAEKMYKTVLTVEFATDEGLSTFQWVAFIGAKRSGDNPESFDWKRMGGVAEIPAGTKQIIFALQGYGPGKVWLDDVSANYVSTQFQSENHS